MQITDIDCITGESVLRDATDDEMAANQAILDSVAALEAQAAKERAEADIAVQAFEQQYPGLITALTPIIKAANLNLPIGDGL